MRQICSFSLDNDRRIDLIPKGGITGKSSRFAIKSVAREFDAWIGAMADSHRAIGGLVMNSTKQAAMPAPQSKVFSAVNLDQRFGV
jgi:hypothetical protein